MVQAFNGTIAILNTILCCHTCILHHLKILIDLKILMLHCILIVKPCKFSVYQFLWSN